MAFEFKLPDLGEGIHEAQLLAWKVAAGQEVVAFQPLCEVESAKAAVELTAPVAGRVVETRFAEGDIARLGDVLVVIDTDGSGTAPAAARAQASPGAEGAGGQSNAGAAVQRREAEASALLSRGQPSAATAQSDATDAAVAARAERSGEGVAAQREGGAPSSSGGRPNLSADTVAAHAERSGEEAAAEADWFGIVGRPPRGAAAPPQAGPTPRAPERVRAAPFVRKLARDLGVPLEEVAGSGAHGRVRIADVEARAAPAGVAPAAPTIPFAEAAPGAGTIPPAQAAPAAPTLPTVEAASRARTIPLRGLRKSIADHMVQAWRNAPQVTSMDLLDVTELLRARNLLSGTAQAQGTRLTYVPFFVKAAVAALKAVPIANAVVDEAKSVIVLGQEYHIGIATAVPDGLVVPVVKHADRLTLLEIAREIERLVGAARERRAVPADLTGGTFTITSFGGLPGSPLFATPILNYPEVAILGLGRIDRQPRVVDGQVVARECIGASFTFDHRALDGEAAGQFMSAFKKYLEQPLELLLTLR